MSDARREPISKKLRFEVFKRDKFTCQYCGRSAPEVVLHCDHISPVAEGGRSDILNLVTSCAGCNSGKGARPLSDSTVMSKQKAMLDELEERRQQIEMMLEWRQSLLGVAEDAVGAVEQIISAKSGWTLNENGKSDVRRWLKRFDLDVILEAAEESFNAYLQFIDDKPTDESWAKAFGKIPNFASLILQKRDKPYMPRLAYIQGIIRKRSRAYRYDCIDYLEHLHLCGADLEDMERRAKRLKEIADFEGPYDAWLVQIGRPF